jgi:hypothetical protein
MWIASLEQFLDLFIIVVSRDFAALKILALKVRISQVLRAFGAGAGAALFI